MTKKINLLFVILGLSLSGLFAQSKGVYVSNVTLDNKDEKWCWAISQDIDNNMLLATATGIVLYDGYNQSVINTPYSPTAIAYHNSSKKAFIGGFESIGLLNYESYGNYSYKPLESYPGNEFRNIHIINDTVLFISDSIIVRYNANTGEKIDKNTANDQIVEMLRVKGKTYYVIGYFLYTINKDGKLIEVSNDSFPVDDFSYTLSVSENQSIIGTNSRNTYTTDGKTFRLKELGNSPFFDNNIITQGLMWGDSAMVLGSLAAGIAIVDIYSGKIVQTVSYFNGLPDDEVRAMFVDNQKGIWVSHEYGISRIDLSINIENYSFYPGLKGVPTSVKFFENEIYVGTNDGLFKLSDVSNYSEVNVSMDVPVDVQVEVQEERNVAADDNSSVKSSDAEDKGSLFSFLSRKKKKDKGSEGQIEEQSSQKTEMVTSKKTITKSERKIITKRSLKSVSHYYEQVKGFNDKCRKLVEFKGALLIAGSNGLYALKYGKVEKLISAYVYDIYYPLNKDQAYCATRNGIYRISKSGMGWDVFHYAKTTDVSINSITRENEQQWVLTLENQVIRCKLEDRNFTVIHQVQLPTPAGITFFVKTANDSTFVYTSKTIYHLTKDGAIIKLRDFDKGSNILNNQTDFTWVYENFGWKNLNHEKQNLISNSAIQRLQLFPASKYIDVNSNGEIWLVDEANNIVRIGKSTSYKFTEPGANILAMQNDGKELTVKKSIRLSANKNNLKVTMSSPYFLKQGGVLYSHLIKGMEDKWTPWSNNPVIDLNYIAPGNRDLVYKVRFATGQESKEMKLGLKVAKPFTQSGWFILLLIIFAGTGVYFFFRIRMQILEKEKQVLEQKVQERTVTITEQKVKIEKQHDEITQSIRYAKRIQSAMLPHPEIIEALMPNHFILFKPRDIVSGDFYFLKAVREHQFVFVAADCTGHGVPGGFMSMLGISFLNEITSQVKNPTAAEILNHLRTKIKLTLQQTDPSAVQKDGMDIALCLIDLDIKKIQYAGAFNPLLLIRNNELNVIEADRQPCAVYFKEVEFENHVIDVQKGDHFYMASDGYVDQIGGPKQRKFMSKNYKELLMNIHNEPFGKQKEILDKNIEDWKGDGMQMDDILVIGFSLD